jgi:N-acetylglucosaminyldiphosphoundecaprenol N-acetyl-beta-D-mannosaminyltransferase
MKVMSTLEINVSASRDAARQLYGRVIGEQPSRPICAGDHDVDAVTTSAASDDLSRAVYGVMGITIDLIDMPTMLLKIEAAAADRAPLLLSTPNLNFLAISRCDPEFRESLLISDLCPADGMPIVWLARLLGVPIKERIAGSDIFEALKSARFASRRLSVFLFGGAKGVASAAAATLNAQPGGMICVGSFNPGFGTIDEMSTDAIIDVINGSQADFLVAALSARKGQRWLLRNHHRLKVPVRSHLGAVLNFHVGSVRRAPAMLRQCGLEWLWRIKEEPYLWRRYWSDGCMLLYLLLTHALPIAIGLGWQRKGWARRSRQTLAIERIEDDEAITFKLAGDANEYHVGIAIPLFRNALKASKHINIDMSGTCVVDTRFIGLLLMLRKQLLGQGLRLSFVGLSPKIAKIFRLNGFEFLCAPGY